MQFLMRIVILLLAALTAQALNCWVCENTPSNEDCQLLGRLQQCLVNEDACQNEVRRDGDGLRITKRCKQALACENNFLQNNRATWFPTQCNNETINSVCRCCCNIRNCNWPTINCDNGVLEATCDPLETPENAEMICTNEENDDGKLEISTTCLFSCNEGFNLVGKFSSECRRTSVTTATFTNPPPRCVGVTSPQPSSDSPLSTPPPPCEALPTPSFGFQTCTPELSKDGAVEGTKCRFDCKEGYVLEGAEEIECIFDEKEHINRFDKKAPTCVRDKLCDDFGPTENGDVVCSDDYNIGSVCKFECNEGFHLFPANRINITCENDTMWSGPKPCCVDSCPVTKMDLAIVLDSSASIGEDNWKKLLQFVKMFVSDIKIGDEAARVSIISYSKKVEKSSRILLNKYSNHQRRLLRNINTKRFQWTADITNTGKALNYVNRVVFRRRNGDRNDSRNVVLVITDGRANDEVFEPARKLRKNADIFALGIEPDANFDFIDLTELRMVAGGSDKVIFVRNGYSHLNQEIAQHLKNHLCNKPSCGKINEEFKDNLHFHNDDD